MCKKTWLKKLLSFGLIAVMILSCLAISGCSNDAPAADEGTQEGNGEEAVDDTVYEWDLVVTAALDHIVSQALQQYADEVDAATNGRLKITIRPNGELPFTQDEYLSACRDGSVEMAMLICSGVSTQLQNASIASLPLLITSPEDQKMYMEILGDTIENELEGHGVSLVTDVYYAGQNFWGAGDAPTTIADLEGLKVRVQGVEQSDFVQQLGMVPVTINWAEVPTSINRGVVDSYITATATVFGGAGNEYTDWGYILPVMNVTTYIVVNDAAMAELPEDIQDTVLELGQKYSESAFSEVADAYDEAALGELENLGMTINYASESEMTELYTMMNDYWREWAEEKGGDVSENLELVLEALGK
ncbi:MAG: TRAP transporter substrate-binding protein DctP [Lachnospiraceae bacterium]|nr:TRAP transporter substrate-binding protein DctP [Lachnospiraceae bacterium]